VGFSQHGSLQRLHYLASQLCLPFWFTEDFDTLDLKVATALLDELA
jgi:hypothetical protein